MSQSHVLHHQRSGSGEREREIPDMAPSFVGFWCHFIRQNKSVCWLFFFSLFFINIRQSQTATANATATVLLNSDRTSWWAELCTMKTKQEQTWPRFVSWALLEHGARTTPSLRLFYRNTQYMKAQTSGKICSFKLIKTLFSSVLSPVFFFYLVN